MIILTSAAVVQGDLRSEFGPLPPVFLPVGNQPLLHWQLELLQTHFGNEAIILSLPEDYVLTPIQESLIKRSTVQVVRVPNRFTLASSILFVLNVVDNRDEFVRVLHGDTLLDSIPSQLDIIGVSNSTDSYDWQLAEPRSEENLRDEVWCGHFSFSDRGALVRALALHDESFSSAVFGYAESRPMKNTPSSGWLDLGHLNTYFYAREKFTTQRSFNDLRIGDGLVWKSGQQKEKLAAEARWFLGLPFEYKKFVPSLYSFDEQTGEYCLEYLPNVPLNELFVHGAHHTLFWRDLVKRIGGWVKGAVRPEFSGAEQVEQKRHELVVTKTRDRLLQFQNAFGFSIDSPVLVNGQTLPSIRSIVDELIAIALRNPVLPGLVHGDLCFSNTLYDSRNRCIRVLDPRGVKDTQFESFIGDVGYDIAKFAHSAVGFYDIIIAGGFDLEYDLDLMEFHLHLAASDRHQNIRNLVLNSGLFEDGLDDISDYFAQMILLFLSMPPLHSNDPSRQWALFVNGLCLYSEFILKD